VLQDAGGQGSSYADAINDSRQSLGNSLTASGQDAVLWSPSGKARVLQDAGGHGYSDALAINASGQSVGWSDLPSGVSEALLWSPSGKATVLQNVFGGRVSSEAVAINDAGWSVG